MLYDIRLTITYSYDSPAQGSRSLLRMLPRELPGQRRLSGLVSTDPPPNWRRDGVDFFGNPTTEVGHDLSLDRIAFHFAGRVERTVDPVGLDLSGPLAELPAEVEAVRSIGPDSPHHFLGPSPRIPDEAEIAAFARAALPPDASVLQAVRAISGAVHGRFDFAPGATEVATAPLDAFRSRRGVCQDMSQVAIAALRALGIPAGYVSGFLRTEPPEGQLRLEGADAMHAWVRAWCGAETGWIEVDPTNDMDAAADHVAVALGRDYSDVAPVRGWLRSQGTHRTAHSVDVVPV